MTIAVSLASLVIAGTQGVHVTHVGVLVTLVVQHASCRNNDSGDPLGGDPDFQLAYRLNNDSGDHAVSCVVVLGTRELHSMLPLGAGPGRRTAPPKGLRRGLEVGWEVLGGGHY